MAGSVGQGYRDYPTQWRERDCLAKVMTPDQIREAQADSEARRVGKQYERSLKFVADSGQAHKSFSDPQHPPAEDDPEYADLCADPFQSKARLQQAHKIRSEIENAENSGRTSPLPAGTPCRRDGSLPPGKMKYEIKNSTPYDLRIVVSGPGEQEIGIPPNASRAAIISPGEYKILGKVTSTGVLPFYGTRIFAPGDACASEFYLETKP